MKEPKKGDFSVCDNSRGITLLGVLSSNSKSDQDDRGPEDPGETSRVQSTKRLLRSNFCSEKHC